MNPVEKETAESFLRDRRTRSSADAAIRWSKRIWCACRRISPAGAEEVWLQGVCRENTGGEILPSKKLFAEKGKELFAWRSRWDSNPRASKG